MNEGPLRVSITGGLMQTQVSTHTHNVHVLRDNITPLRIKSPQVKNKPVHLLITKV